MISFIYWNQLPLQLGLVNTDKVNLITLLLENIEIYHKHNKRIEQYLEQKNVTENCCNDEAPSSNYADQNGEGNDKNVCATDATNADKQKLPKKVSLAVHPYEPIQAIPGASHGFFLLIQISYLWFSGVTLIPLNSAFFDLDMIQRIHHGTTVIRYDPDTGRVIIFIINCEICMRSGNTTMEIKISL